MANIGRLKDRLDAAGIKQNELADALGISDAQVSRLLSGSREMKLKTAEAIVDFLRARTSNAALSHEDVFGEPAPEPEPAEAEKAAS